ncbi:MAG: LemA family protein [Planctomycetota bacterium]|nr:MAG: LemA family protein [Planctomycetota bacterium]
MEYTLILLVVITGLLLLYVAYSYNKLVRLSNLLKEGWSGVEVHLKKRYDLIPNLVEVVKSYKNYEKDLLEKVTRQRSLLERGSGPSSLAGEEEQISQSLKSILALAENYPDLKANQQFRDLQRALISVENDLEKARRYYNGTVRNLNIYIQSLPSCFVARFFGFPEGKFFEISSPVERSNPQTNF